MCACAHAVLAELVTSEVSNVASAGLGVPSLANHQTERAFSSSHHATNYQTSSNFVITSN